MAQILKAACLCILLVAEKPAQATNDELFIPLHSHLISLDPRFAQDAQSLWVARQVNCQLVRLNGKNIEFEAAKKIDFVNQRILNIQLDESKRFHDGTPLTSEDVVASFQALRKSRTVLRNVLDKIDSFKVKSKFEFQIFLKKSEPQFLNNLGAPNYAIFSKKFLEKSDKDINLWRTPLGCGNYRVDPTLSFGKEVRLIPVREGFPVVFALREGQKLTATELSRAAILDAPFSIQYSNNKGMSQSVVFDPRQIYLSLNKSLPRWRNKNTRCQFFKKIKREQILEKYKGEARMATSVFPEGILGYSSVVKFPWVNSIDESHGQQTLAKKFRLLILGLSVPEEIRASYQAMISAAGFDVSLEILEDASTFGESFRKSGADGFVIGLKSNFFDGYEFLAIAAERSANINGVFDASLAKLVRASLESTLSADRSSGYRNAEAILLDDCSIYPLLTIPNRNVQVSNAWIFPKLGQVPMNEFDLGAVRRK